ncbi:MAG: WGxxGxxG family protein [Gaiellaceae bacterium]
MRKRITVLLAVGALGAGAASPVALAQETETEAASEDEGSDFGWVGLLGLAGLAGLMGRKRDHQHDDADKRR